MSFQDPQVRMPRLGKVRIVVSCAQKSLTGRSVVRVTNRMAWSAAKSIGLYGQQWLTDTCNQDSKGPLGCNESRLCSAEVTGKHQCLVCMAYSL
jgi:hypothetical protein